MTGLRFHNVDADPADDVRTWPYEALVTAIDHGLVPDWRPVFAEIRRSPWGLTAQRVERYLGYRDPDSVSTLFTLAIEHARRNTGPSEQATESPNGSLTRDSCQQGRAQARQQPPPTKSHNSGRPDRSL